VYGTDLKDIFTFLITSKKPNKATMSDRKPPRAPTHHHAGRSPDEDGSAVMRTASLPIPIGPQIGGFTISESVGGTMYGTTPGGMYLSPHP
jgi:hypothetical protein